LYKVNRIGLDMITTLQGEWRRAQQALEIIGHSLQIFENQFRARSQVHNTPRENAASLEILGEIINQADIDHMELDDVNGEEHKDSA